MQFNRPPRLQKTLPQDKVSVPETPPLPQKPDGNNWLGILLPIGGMLIVVALMAMINGAHSSIMYLIMLPMMLASSVAGIFGNSAQKKKFESGLAEARKNFRDSLRSVEEKLSGLRKRELAVRLETDPSPEECIGRITRQDPRIGERRPHDNDFLYLRCGLGDVPASFSVDAEYQREKQAEFLEEYKFIEELSAMYAMLKDVPIRIPLAEIGGLGISGPRLQVMDTARALLVQLLTHHWIDEVRFGILTPDRNLSAWGWADQLPQMSSILSTNKGENILNARLNSLEQEMQQRRQQQEISKQVGSKSNSEQQEPPLPRLVILIDSLPEGFTHSALDLLEKQGRELGIYCIYLCDKPEHIPGSCGGMLVLNGSNSIYSQTGEEGIQTRLKPDAVKIEEANAFARAMGEITWPGESNASRPPDLITFLEMYGVKRVEELPIEDWWENEPPYGYLRAPLGAMSSTTNFIFDLNDKDGAHGPHGLLGGMTGSGKSEVLKTIILSLALCHHPYDLNFALIDFKGGAAFNELAALPHTVGVVTDIESNATFAERVIQALNGEIQRRKVVLERARAVYHFSRPHIDEYRKLKIREPLPRLLIIFDEFAEFKQRNPEESKKLISIARQGRSLGVHLLLATQNITAAVDPEIMQNSTYKICLRMAQAQDSMQLIGIPDAVNILRGRAYFSAGTRILYQSAFAGADYYPLGEDTEGCFVRIWPDGRREILKTPETEEQDFGPKAISEALAVIEAIQKTAEKLNLKHPPAVWPDALPEKLYLPDLLNDTLVGGWDGKEWQICHKWGTPADDSVLIYPYLGICDFPAQQQQLPFCADVHQGTNMLIFGSAGTGKSTMLRTLVTSLALTNAPDEVIIYVIDYGGQTALKVLEEFPHVGAVITRIETERTERLIQMLQKEVFRRNDLLRDANVDNRVDYNATVSREEQLPAIYLLIDNYGSLRRTFEPEFLNSISSLMSGGQSAGLYMVIASSLQGDIPNEMFANVNNRLTFLQADTSEYYRIVGHPSDAKLEEDAIKGIRPGRGLLRGTRPIEFQAALPAYGTNDREQLQNLMTLAENMKEAWKGPLPAPVQTLPLFAQRPKIEMAENVRAAYASYLGLNFDWLYPIGFTLLGDGPTFLITSPSRQTGKTTLITSWLLDLCKNYSKEELQIYLIDFHGRTMTAFRKAPQVTYIASNEDMRAKLDDLINDLSLREEVLSAAYENDPDNFDPHNVLKQFPRIVIAIDNYEALHQKYPDSSEPLANCLQKGGELGCSFIIAAKLTELPSNYEDRFIAQFRKRGTGILLGGAEGIDEFNNTRRPQGAAPAGLPAGRGYLVSRGMAGMLQTFTWWDPEEDPEESLIRQISELNG